MSKSIRVKADSVEPISDHIVVHKNKYFRTLEDNKYLPGMVTLIPIGV